MLAQDLRPLKGQENLHVTERDKKKSKKGMRLDLCHREGAAKEERSCVLASPLTSREIGQDGGGASEPQRGTQSGLWRSARPGLLRRSVPRLCTPESGPGERTGPGGLQSGVATPDGL